MKTCNSEYTCSFKLFGNGSNGCDYEHICNYQTPLEPYRITVTNTCMNCFAKEKEVEIHKNEIERLKEEMDNYRNICERDKNKILDSAIAYKDREESPVVDLLKESIINLQAKISELESSSGWAEAIKVREENQRLRNELDKLANELEEDIFQKGK